ncbi:pectin lyase fold/virulence factor [Pelagophyceae sp. CCMP2097]|nr:pectin lyase fold/virulence factor [Pelagophyceae sp. CCMP2097]
MRSLVPPLLLLRGASSLRVSRHMELRIGSEFFSVLDFGAQGDGKSDDTDSIQAALDACASKGGGVVLLPAGEYLSFGGLEIKSNFTELRIEGSLTIHDDRKAYSKKCGDKPIIHAQDLSDVAITGSGLIDGQGKEWWQHRDDFRPEMVSSKRVTRFLVHGLTFTNPPNHCLEVGGSFLEISHVTVLAPPSTGVPEDQRSHNTDAIDVHASSAYIHDSYLSTGDDNIAFHASNSIVERCFFGSGHGTSIGSLCDDSVENITVLDSVFENTTCAIRIKTREGCSGSVSNVRWEGLRMTNVEQPVDIDMFYTYAGVDQDVEPEAGSTRMKISDVVIRNVSSVGHRYEGAFHCDSRSPCSDFTLEDVRFGEKDQWTCPGGKGDDCCQNIRGRIDNVQPRLGECFQHS